VRESESKLKEYKKDIVGQSDTYEGAALIYTICLFLKLAFASKRAS